MRILITGVAGFIGSHTSERLLANGHSVVGLDNFDPFYDRLVKESNLCGSLSHDSFVFVEACICDGSAMASVLDEHGPFDAILHLAAKAGVRPSIADPAGYVRTNVLGTTNLLELAARMRPVPKFIFASSSSVYGNSLKVPFSETDPVDEAISPYAATKKACEVLCYTYHHLFGLPVFCLRFFTVYGPRQRPDLAIHRFALLLLADQPVPMFGDGVSYRDYTYIDDIVTGICRAIELCDGYEIINLGGGDPVALKEMIQVLSEACARDVTIEELPDQPGDVKRTFADICKARRLLDYNPATPFREGVQQFIGWLHETSQPA